MRPYQLFYRPERRSGIAVAYIILRSGVDDNVGAPVQGPHNEGGDEGVINNDLTAMSVGILSNSGDISQLQQGIGQGLKIDDLRIRLHRFFDVFQISDVYAGCFDALGRRISLNMLSVQMKVSSFAMT